MTTPTTSSPRAEVHFLEHTKRQGECLIWTGRTMVRGYGVLSSKGVEVLAHRHSWEREHGAIQAGVQIDHATCHNKKCVRVAHLRLATGHQNQRNRSGPNVNGSTGYRNVHMSNGHPMVRVQKNGIVHRLFGFSTVQEASVAARDLREKLFGEFAGRG